MLGERQAATGERLSPRRLAQIAGVPKDLVYRLDAGEARYVDLKALARLCDALHCRAEEILVWESRDEWESRVERGENGRSE
jgi:DNA-binding Xre family transcriptional regulator